MDTKELLAKVKRIELKTKSKSGNVFSGQYHSSFKGKGMIFSEVRQYEVGDDIRNIDWNVTAKLSDTYVKSFEEEREMTVMLLVDVSSSQNIGSGKYTKQEIVTEVCATIAFSAMLNGDKVGLVMFSDKIHKFIPPQKGKKHVLRILRDLLDTQTEYEGTKISEGIDFVNRILKKKSIVFMISDFIDKDYERSLKLLSKKHELIGLKVGDEFENKLPDLGFVLVEDKETGKKRFVNTWKKSNKSQWENYFKNYDDNFERCFKKMGARHQIINTDGEYMKTLIKTFS